MCHHLHVERGSEIQSEMAAWGHMVMYINAKPERLSAVHHLAFDRRHKDTEHDPDVRLPN